MRHKAAPTPTRAGRAGASILGSHCEGFNLREGKRTKEGIFLLHGKNGFLVEKAYTVPYTILLFSKRLLGFFSVWLPKKVRFRTLTTAANRVLHRAPRQRSRSGAAWRRGGRHGGRHRCVDVWPHGDPDDSHGDHGESLRGPSGTEKDDRENRKRAVEEFCAGVWE